jgi:hypothetical protein
LEMSKGKSIMVRQIEYNQFNGLKNRNKQWSSEHYTKTIFSNFPFCTIWSPLWCLLITLLFFSDYGLGIFRSLGWYLQITPLVSSDHSSGIFWLPLCYLLITPDTNGVIRRYQRRNQKIPKR